MWRSVLAVGSSLLVLGEEGEKPCSISVYCSDWDDHLQKFLPPLKWSIPLKDNMRVVAAESVANYASGEIEPYIVLSSCSALAMGLLDISKNKLTIVAQLTYHEENSSAKLECLLTNGPTTIALVSGKILLMYHHHVRDSKHFHDEYKAVEPMWIAYILNIDQICVDADIRLLFAHDGNSACTPEVVLGISNVSKSLMSCQRANQNLRRSNVDWKYIRLDLYSLGCYMLQLNIAENYSNYSVEQPWMQMYKETDSLLCNEIFPADLNPFAISCIKLVPVDPLSLVADSSVLEGTKSESFPDIIIGTYDHKVLKCRHGKIIANAYLNDAPVSLNFAVVAGGQGVLLATIASSEQNVIALCCETLQQLEVWSNVGNVITGDFRLVGHDQVLLLKSPAHCKLGIFPMEDLLSSIIITDLKWYGFSGLNDLQQELKFADSFEATVHKSQHIQTVARFLETRIEAERSQEKQLKLQMEKKKHLLESSCELMEGLTSRHSLAFVEQNSLLESKNSKSKIKGGHLPLVELEQVYHALQGRTWFIVIGIWSRVPRGLILDKATLLLVTVKGQISVVNIIFKAWLTTEETIYNQGAKSATAEHELFSSNNNGGTHRCLHTEWLGRICIEENDLIRQFAHQGLSYVIHGVGESLVFMFRPIQENDPSTLPSEIKSVLHMDYSRKEYGNLQATENRICVLEAQEAVPFREAHIYIFKDVALVTLYAEDSELLSCTAALLISIFQHQYDVYQYRPCERILAAIFDFIGAFSQELGVKSSTREAKICELQQCLTVEKYQELELMTDEACLHLLPRTRF
ncbi:uncharacterized protein LOC131049802 isoform X2 [Cryptomeria japonica]|uniref:uncharacterized protein LOC131049802 isoform X2 n=1 Tax=Cryptomeria japonica TaxID=3369 RepID=UPI0027DA0B84|nr:uncharacterized protein LOC131049802 isoform X2 [Cryptomeria japonica]